MAERVGQVFCNYQLLRLLGRGAFAEVYLAEHRYLGTHAALKILHVRMEPDDHVEFQREALKPSLTCSMTISCTSSISASRIKPLFW